MFIYLFIYLFIYYITNKIAICLNSYQYNLINLKKYVNVCYRNLKMRGIIVLFAIVATIAVTSASIGGRNPGPPPLIVSIA